MAECEKQFFMSDGNNVNNGAFPAEPLWENKTLSQIYLNSFIYCFFYNDIWLGYRNRMQIKSPPPPRPFFIWLLKRCCWFTIRNVCLFFFFFFELFAESSTADCCWQVISHSLWELIAFGQGKLFLQETQFAKKGAANCSLPGENFLLNILKFSIKQSCRIPRFQYGYLLQSDEDFITINTF